MWTGICWDSSSWHAASRRVTNKENKRAVCHAQSFIKCILSSPASPVSKNLQEVLGHINLQLIPHGHHPPSPRSPKHLAMHQSFLLPLRRAWPAEAPADTLFFFKNLEVLIGKGMAGMSLCALAFLLTWTQTGWGLVFAPHQCNAGNKPAGWNTCPLCSPHQNQPCKLWLSNWLHFFPWAHINSHEPPLQSQPWLPWRWNRNEGDAFRSWWWQRQPAEAILAAGVLMHPQHMFINNFCKLPANPQFRNICGRADNLYKVYMGWGTDSLCSFFQASQGPHGASWPPHHRGRGEFTQCLGLSPSIWGCWGTRNAPCCSKGLWEQVLEGTEAGGWAAQGCSGVLACSSVSLMGLNTLIKHCWKASVMSATDLAA